MSSEALIIIPAFDPPEEELFRLLEKLYSLDGEREILLFNDGSHKKTAPFFRMIREKYPRLHFLEHEKNRGKGRTLQEAFSYAGERFPSSPIVTADCDGQHAPEDILRLAFLAEEEKADLILGVREFAKESVPFRSRLGNHLAAQLFALFYGRRLADTQTGLRALSPAFAEHVLLSCRGNGYEFEMEMLLACIKNGFSIREEKIKTIYSHSGRVSHFKPLRDTLRIFQRLLFSLGKK